MLDIEIKLARWEDLSLLNEFVPLESVFSNHERVLDMQDNGEAEYLIVWLEGRPVGHGWLKFSGFRTPAIAKHFAPDTPLLRELHVIDELQGRGIGTRLVTALEDRARLRGCTEIGLAYEEDNPRAGRLYERLGYKDWGRGPIENAPWVVTDENGAEHTRVQRIIPMSKQL